MPHELPAHNARHHHHSVHIGHRAVGAATMPLSGPRHGRSIPESSFHETHFTILSWRSVRGAQPDPQGSKGSEAAGECRGNIVPVLITDNGKAREMIGGGVQGG